MYRLTRIIPAFLMAVGSAAAGTLPGGDAVEGSAASRPGIGHVPLQLSFEANRGQTDDEVEFLSRGRGYTLFLTPREAVLRLKPAQRGRQKAPGDRLTTADEPPVPNVVRMRLEGANPEPRLSGLEALPGKSNYFVGRDPAEWQRDIPHYARVRYDEVYPGVDLVFYGNQGQLEHDFVVAPGARPESIRLAFQGADALEVDAGGDLVMQVGDDRLRLKKPFIYQERHGVRERIAGGYVVEDDRVGFEIAAYDRSRPLVIDPVLVYSTYLGGTRDDYARGIAVDGDGNAYVSGSTDSTDFPTANALQSTKMPESDIFVTKLDSTGALIHSTYIGGSGEESGSGIAVDEAGDAYLAGGTSSSDFPVVNPFQPTQADPESSDVFVLKLDTSGTALVYSSYLGGTERDGAHDIAVDSSGSAYVTGATNSLDFPTVFALQASNGGGRDGFVAKVNATGSALVYSTYLGGGNTDIPIGVAVNAEGQAHITGQTLSSDFPTFNAFQSAYWVEGEGTKGTFVTKLDATGSTFVYSTYLGPSIRGTAIAVDDQDQAYVVGITRAADFPTTSGAFQTVLFDNRFDDGFVTKLDPTGTALVYSTYLGGSHSDHAAGVAVDSSGNAYVTGHTVSTDFPVFDPIQPFLATAPDAFVTKLNPTGSHLAYSTYLGGDGSDRGTSIAVDASGSAHVIGYTVSENFPVVNAAQPFYAGGTIVDRPASDGFVAKIAASRQSPFTGTPFVAPGLFEAEDFDLGGEGVAYHDVMAGNAGGEYRTSEDVDIIAASGNASGYVVNNIQTGEWLEYTIDVATSGSYRIELHVSSEFSTSRFHVEIDGIDVTGSLLVPNTGWWGTFQWVGAGDIQLAAGQHILRVHADQEYFNLDAVDISSESDDTPPTVAITSPADGDTVSGSIAVVAEAADNTGVVGVRFFVDGTAIGAEDTAAPYEVAWDTTEVADGSHSLTAEARDAVGNTTLSSAIAVTVDNVDTTTPTVAITSPPDESIVSGTVTVTAEASDDVGVAVVEFWIYLGYHSGSVILAKDTTAPYSFDWDTTKYANEAHSLHAVARDSAGNAGSSAPPTVLTVDNPPGIARIEETDRRISFGSGWTLDDTSRAWSGGTAAVTTRAQESSSARFKFKGGESVKWIGYRGPEGGIAQIWLGYGGDYREKLLAEVDTYAPEEEAGAVLFSVVAPRAGDGWTLDIDPIGPKNPDATDSLVVVDAFDVRTASDGTEDTNPPSISITAPADGEAVSGTTTITVDAFDDVELAGVQYWLDKGPNGGPLGQEVTSAPYSLDWDTTTTSQGLHTLTAVARDVEGNTTSTSITVGVDNSPPSVAISWPADGATVSGTATVSADASDGESGVAGVRFFADGTAIGAEDTVAPYEVAWDTTKVSDGSHSLTAEARDAAGNTTTSVAVTVTVNNSGEDTTAPSVTVTSPADGSTVLGTITVSADASDESGVEVVQFRLDGEQLGELDSTEPYEVTWDTTTASDGSHILQARAQDSAGNTTTSEAVTVTVDNGGDTTPPSVAVTSPSDGSTVSGAITVSADASDESGSGVKVVQFLLDGEQLWELDSTEPYEVTWDTTTAADGSHTLQARARDSAGNTGESTVITVTVDNGGGGSGGGGSGRIEETDAAIAYAGTWVTRGSEVASFSGGSAVSSEETGAHASFTFTGTGVSWVGLRCNVCGIAEVSIDGGAATSVDTAGTAAPGSTGLASEVVFTSPPLADGTHTLAISVTGTTRTGGTHIVVDAFDVAYSTTSTTGTAVAWTDLVNVTASGNSLEKTSGCDGCEDGGASSMETISSGDGYVEFIVSETTTARAIGLSHGDTDTSRADIDFGIQLWPGGGADVRENGIYRTETMYASGDVFRIAVESSAVNYYRNGTRFHTSGVAPTYPLLVDTTLWDVTATVSDVVIGGVEVASSGDATPSSVTMISLAEAETVSGAIPVAADAFDDIGGAVVQSFIDGGAVGTEERSLPTRSSGTPPRWWPTASSTFTAMGVDNA